MATKNSGVFTPYPQPNDRRWTRKLAAALVVVMAIGAVPSLALAETHTVEPGDTLSVIARDYGVSTADLAKANGISNLHLIRVGQSLEIPRSFHQVQSGDTLSEIAVAYGVSTSEIMALNGLGNANVIRVGQQIELPAGASAATGGTSTAAAPADPAARYASLPGRLMANPDRLSLIPSFEKWSQHYGVPTDLLMAVAYRESGWQQNVISPKGAIGVGQILPRTAEWLANDLIQIPELSPNVADDNIRMSARFLAWLVGYMGSVDAAVAGYYQGPTSVNNRGLYDDTKAYIDNINQIRSRFAAST